jgi:hypothetical protein
MKTLAGDDKVDVRRFGRGATIWSGRDDSVGALESDMCAPHKPIELSDPPKAEGKSQSRGR